MQGGEVGDRRYDRTCAAFAQQSLHVVELPCVQIRLQQRELDEIDLRAAIVAAVGFAGLFVFHLGMFRTLGICAALGLVLRLAV